MNILIIKIGALGDVVRTSFIAQALKDKYKSRNPKIYWITDEKAIPLFINNPYIDEVIKKGDKNKLQNKYFDLIINLEEDEESCSFVSSLQSKEVRGFILKGRKILPTKTAEEWFNMSAIGKKPENDILKKKNKKEHRQIIAEIVGINNWQKYEPFLRLTENQRKMASDFLRRHNLSRTDLIVGINLGAADRWPKSLSIRKTAKLIDLIYKKHKSSILLFGGPNEIERNKKIMSLSHSPIITTGCGNDLIEFPALINACGLLITSDTLGLHIGLALKRKTIILIGPTSPSEIGTYGIGEKIIAKSSCICCYNHKCKSMEKISLEEVMKRFDSLIKQKITLVITAFKEPGTIGKAIEHAQKQKTNYEYDILVSVPDKETLDIAKKYAEKDKRIRIVKDPGKGKSFALNLIFKNVESDILILTDGDVSLNDLAVEELTNLFLDPEIGCATGKPVPEENKSTKYGYWANFLFEAAHNLRKFAFEKNAFLECSAYLFAFRKKMINQIPIDVADDAVIPYMFWEKGYKIGYAEKAEVYIKNVDNWKDWISQKTRTSKAHETLDKYVDIHTTKRVKTFGTEAKGITLLFSYPQNLKEFFWSIELAFARAYMWFRVFYDTKFKNKHYGDAWERVESAR